MMSQGRRATLARTSGEGARALTKLVLPTRDVRLQRALAAEARTYSARIAELDKRSRGRCASEADGDDDQRGEEVEPEDEATDGRLAPLPNANATCENQLQMEEPMKVTVTEPGIAGSYVLEERNPDGSLLLWPDTSVDAIQRRVGGRPMTDEEFEDALGDLPTDGEG